MDLKNEDLGLLFNPTPNDLGIALANLLDNPQQLNCQVSQIIYKCFNSYALILINLISGKSL